MAAPIPAETRAAVEAAIRAGHGTVSCRGLAREYGISTGTVRNIAKAAGLADAFARAGTQNATRARTADMASRRAGLAEKMLDLADHIAARATSSYVEWVGTRDGVERVTYDEPPLGEVRQAMTAVGIAVDKHMALIRFDTKEGNGSSTAHSLVSALAAQFGLDGSTPADYDDGYPVPLPTPEQVAAGAAELEAEAARANPPDPAPPADPGGAGGDLG